MSGDARAVVGNRLVLVLVLVLALVPVAVLVLASAGAGVLLAGPGCVLVLAGLVPWR